jgi:hypothetical protein
MGLKIKWNDDRVRAATTAILLIGRDHLRRGEAEDLIQASLDEYRSDPERYKQNKASWSDVQDLGPLTKPAQAALYRNLLNAIEALMKKLEKGKPQFNSLLELDNWLVASLRNVR